MTHRDDALEQHRDVQRAHKLARIVVLSAIVLVTLALVLVGLVLWIAISTQDSVEVRGVSSASGRHPERARRQPATPPRRTRAAAWAELEVGLTPSLLRHGAHWARAAWGRRLISSACSTGGCS